MVTSSPSTSAPGTDKTGMDFRRILPEIRCQSCLSPGSEPTPRGGLSSPVSRASLPSTSLVGPRRRGVPQIALGAPVERVEEQRERRVGLRAMLRTDAEQHDLAGVHLDGHYG